MFSKKEFGPCTLGELNCTAENIEYVKAIHIPLLTLDQLIDFIEWKIGRHINKIEYVDGTYEIEVCMDNGIKRFVDEELISVAWKAVQGVCEDNVIEVNFNRS